MSKKPRTFSLAIVILLVFSVPLLAHHGAASFDTSKLVTVKGKVTNYVWANPHVYIEVDSKDVTGNTVHWIIEAQDPVAEINVGWSNNTFKLGDDVIIDCNAAKNGKPIGRVGFTTRIVINGKQFKP